MARKRSNYSLCKEIFVPWSDSSRQFVKVKIRPKDGPGEYAYRHEKKICLLSRSTEPDFPDINTEGKYVSITDNRVTSEILMGSSGQKIKAFQTANDFLIRRDERSARDHFYMRPRIDRSVLECFLIGKVFLKDLWLLPELERQAILNFWCPNNVIKHNLVLLGSENLGYCEIPQNNLKDVMDFNATSQCRIKYKINYEKLFLLKKGLL